MWTLLFCWHPAPSSHATPCHAASLQLVIVYSHQQEEEEEEEEKEEEEKSLVFHLLAVHKWAQDKKTKGQQLGEEEEEEVRRYPQTRFHVCTVCSVCTRVSYRLRLATTTPPLNSTQLNCHQHRKECWNWCGWTRRRRRRRRRRGTGGEISIIFPTN